MGLSWAHLALSMGRSLPALPGLASIDWAKLPPALNQAAPPPTSGAAHPSSPAPAAAASPVALMWWALSPSLAPPSLQPLAGSGAWPQHHTRLLQAVVGHNAPTALAPFQALSGPAPASAWTPSTDTLLHAARRALQATCQHLGLWGASREGQGRPGALHCLLHPAAATQLAAQAARLHGPHAAVAVVASWALERPLASR